MTIFLFFPHTNFTGIENSIYWITTSVTNVLSAFQCRRNLIGFQQIYCFKLDFVFYTSALNVEN